MGGRAAAGCGEEGGDHPSGAVGLVAALAVALAAALAGGRRRGLVDAGAAGGSGRLRGSGVAAAGGGTMMARVEIGAARAVPTGNVGMCGGGRRRLSSAGEGAATVAVRLVCGGVTMMRMVPVAGGVRCDAASVRDGTRTLVGRARGGEMAIGAVAVRCVASAAGVPGSAAVRPEAAVIRPGGVGVRGGEARGGEARGAEVLGGAVRGEAVLPGGEVRGGSVQGGAAPGEAVREGIVPGVGPGRGETVPAVWEVREGASVRREVPPEPMSGWRDVRRLVTAELILRRQRVHRPSLAFAQLQHRKQSQLLPARRIPLRFLQLEVHALGSFLCASTVGKLSRRLATVTSVLSPLNL